LRLTAVDDSNFVAKMNEVVASSSMWQPYAFLTQRLTAGQGRKGKSDFQVKKNAIFKRAREHNGQISRETLASVYVARVSGGSRRFLTLLRHDARAMLEEIMAETAQDRGMGDLIPMLSRRDVRDRAKLCSAPS
jgi:hypothetical protein